MNCRKCNYPIEGLTVIGQDICTNCQISIINRNRCEFCECYLSEDEDQMNSCSGCGEIYND